MYEFYYYIGYFDFIWNTYLLTSHTKKKQNSNRFIRSGAVMPQTNRQADRQTNDGHVKRITSSFSCGVKIQTSRCYWSVPHALTSRVSRSLSGVQIGAALYGELIKFYACSISRDSLIALISTNTYCDFVLQCDSNKVGLVRAALVFKTVFILSNIAGRAI